MATTDLLPISIDRAGEAAKLLKDNLGDVKSVTINDNGDYATLTVESASALAGTDLRLTERVREEFLVDKVVGETGSKNFSFSLSSNVLSVLSESGYTFDASRIGLAKFDSVNRPGESFTAALTSDITSDELNGDNLTGMLWGTKTGVAWGNNRPLYIYAINEDDTNANVKLFISGYWKTDETTSPSTTTKFGKVTSLPSEVDHDAFVAFDSSITAADYAGKPMVCLGVVLAQKDASNDWTFQTLTAGTGAGNFGHEVWYDLVEGGIPGSATGSYFGSNGPDWSGTNIYKYQLHPDGRTTNFFQTAGTRTNGSSSGALALYTFAKSQGNQTAGASYRGGSGRVDAQGATNDPFLAPSFYTIQSIAYVRVYDHDGNFVAYNDFSNAADDMNLTWTMFGL
jgi:hypothetical protein